jgi:hypothetical protein
MTGADSQLDRIENLLREGNDLRRQAIALQGEAIATQREALATQKSLIDQQRSNLAKASQVNDQALVLQTRARRLVTFLIPILIVLVLYVSWILFTRRYA